jgi:hypothetical protein
MDVGHPSAKIFEQYRVDFGDDQGVAEPLMVLLFVV